MKSVLLALVLASSSALAFDDGDIRIGGQAGHVGLLGDVGDKAGNSMGYGALLGYAASSETIFNIGYTTSSHKDLKHSDLNVGVDFYLNSYDVSYAYLSAGVDFIGHELSAISMSSSGFGVYGGLGVDFELGKHATAGVQALYHNAFETSVTIAGNTNVKAIQSYVTVMLRALFTLSGKD